MMPLPNTSSPSSSLPIPAHHPQLSAASSKSLPLGRDARNRQLVERANIVGGHVRVGERKIVLLRYRVRRVAQLHFEQPFGQVAVRRMAMLNPVGSKRAPQIMGRHVHNGALGDIAEYVPDAGIGDAEYQPAFRAGVRLPQLQQPTSHRPETDGARLVVIQIAFDHIEITPARPTRLMGDVFPAGVGGFDAPATCFGEEGNQAHVADPRRAFARVDHALDRLSGKCTGALLGWGGQREPGRYVYGQSACGMQPAKELTCAPATGVNGCGANGGLDALQPSGVVLHGLAGEMGSRQGTEPHNERGQLVAIVGDSVTGCAAALGFGEVDGHEVGEQMGSNDVSSSVGHDAVHGWGAFCWMRRNFVCRFQDASFPQRIRAMCEFTAL